MYMHESRQNGLFSVDRKSEDVQMGYQHALPFVWFYVERNSELYNYCPYFTMQYYYVTS